MKMISAEARQMINEDSGLTEKPAIGWLCRRSEEETDGMPNLRYKIIKEHLKL